MGATTASIRSAREIQLMFVSLIAARAGSKSHRRSRTFSNNCQLLSRVSQPGLLLPRHIPQYFRIQCNPPGATVPPRKPGTAADYELAAVLRAMREAGRKVSVLGMAKRHRGITRCKKLPEALLQFLFQREKRRALRDDAIPASADFTRQQFDIEFDPALSAFGH